MREEEQRTCRASLYVYVSRCARVGKRVGEGLCERRGVRGCDMV